MDHRSISDESGRGIGCIPEGADGSSKVGSLERLGESDPRPDSATPELGDAPQVDTSTPSSPGRTDRMEPTFTAFRESIPDWKDRLDFVVETMRDMSRQQDPEAMVNAYGARIRRLMPLDRFISLSRRGLQSPWLRITRDSLRSESLNPWRDRDRLPLIQRGILAELLYGGEPKLIDDLVVAQDDPGAAFLDGMRSVMVIPHYDNGEATNMVLLMRKEPRAFSREALPEQVWLSNLFGRVTYTLVLSDELKRAYASIEEELKVVASIQRSLLPAKLPKIPNLDLAASYQTSRLAGGDYYDVFPLPGNRWGLLIADVSGHGTPSAVMMAITHALAHTYNGEPIPPSRLLEFVNEHLVNRYTSDSGTFVTAFYGIFDPATRTFVYSSAGHNPPRVKRCADGSIFSLEEAGGLPLGLFESQEYDQAVVDLMPGDQIILYTDGITEATNPAGEQYGLDRLDRAISGCQETADDLIQVILSRLDKFTDGHPAEDDRTLLVAKVS